MSNLFNLHMRHKEVKPESSHPWARIARSELHDKIKHVHNSINNPAFSPKPKVNCPHRPQYKFTVVGCMTTKEFIYCVKLVEGIHKYRPNVFDAPVIRGVTCVEWPQILNECRGFAEDTYCLEGMVIVTCNGMYLGGQKQLKELLESKYIYHIAVNYPKEGIDNFVKFVNSSNRSHVYLNIVINDKAIGSLIFMLYTDIVPRTCENFMRLCKEKRGGYAGTPVHRIVKDGWIQCGGFTLKSSDLDCENFIVQHDRRGVLCMANDGRHKDCSTQFFVLLQPAEWMKHKYVAFGQLIDGETTLQQIEQIETWYESPKADIIVSQSGVLNLDCQDIMINRGAVEYVHGHIEDLVTLRQFLLTMILEHVFLELEFRLTGALGLKLGEVRQKIYIGQTDKDMRTTKRFLRNKSDIMKQLQKASDDQTSQSSINEFSVEDYELEEEKTPQSSPAADSSLSAAIEKKPFYIPFSDVLYPGEKDSNYDIKRMLKGKYCHESDLIPNATKYQFVERGPTRLGVVAEICNALEEPVAVATSTSIFDESVNLNPMDMDIIRDYIRLHSDRVCFAGEVIKNIAHTKYSTVAHAIKMETAPLEDESLRRIRVISSHLEADHQKKVLLNLQPRDFLPSHKIMRRPTGFIKLENLKQLLAVRRKQGKGEMEDEEEEEDDEHKLSIDKDKSKNSKDKPCKKTNTQMMKDGSRVRIVSETEPQNRIRRRQTGFINKEQIAKVLAAHEYDEEEEEKEEEEVKCKSRKESKPGITIKLEKEKPQQKYQEDDDQPDDSSKKKKKISLQFAQEPVDINKIFEDDAFKRSKAVLNRLYKDVKVNKEDDTVPTLKDYKPLTELSTKNLLLTYDIASNVNDDSKEFKHQHYIHHRDRRASQDNYLERQRRKNIKRKISEDNIATLEFDHKKSSHPSLRSLEYAKQRPSLTVSEYQHINLLHKLQNESSKRISNSSNDTIETDIELDKVTYAETHRESKEQVPQRQDSERIKIAPMYTGLRLPGDSPLYLSDDE